MGLTKVSYAMINGAPLNVLDYGADNTGTSNSTTAINNALTAAATKAQSVYFPAGTYLYNGGGLLQSGVVVFGDGRDASIIKSALATPTSGYLFAAFGEGSGLRGLRFIANVTQTGGSYVKLMGAESFIEDFHMDGDFNGIYMTGNVSRIRHGRFQDGAANSIRIFAGGGDNSQLIDDVLMGAQLPQISQVGIKVQNSAALIISNTSVIQQGTGLLVSATSGNDIFSMYVNNCFFDNSSNSGLSITATGTGNVARCRFANCWFGSSTSDGVFINNSGSGLIKGLYFDSCHAVLNGGSGLTTGGTVSDIAITGGLYANNTYGVYFNSGTTASRIVGATVGEGGGLLGNSNSGVVLNTGTQNILVQDNTIFTNTSYGVLVQSGATYFTITDNNFGYNGTALSVPAVTTRVVRNNVGIDSSDIVYGTNFIPTGSTSVVVTHGLGVLPGAKRIFISPNSSWGSNPCYVDTATITTTTFTVKCASAAPDNQYFSWQASINSY